MVRWVHSDFVESVRAHDDEMAGDDKAASSVIAGTRAEQEEKNLRSGIFFFSPLSPLEDAAGLAGRRENRRRRLMEAKYITVFYKHSRESEVTRGTRIVV